MEQKKMSTEAEIRASRKYNKEKAYQYGLTFNRVYDADIITFLEPMENKGQYFRKLIRDDMAKQNAETTVAAQFAGDPMIQIVFKETEQKVADIATTIYNALPDDIQEQIEILVVASEDNPDGYDIVEAAIFADIDE